MGGEMLVQQQTDDGITGGALSDRHPLLKDIAHPGQGHELIEDSPMNVSSGFGGDDGKANSTGTTYDNNNDSVSRSWSVQWTGMIWDGLSSPFSKRKRAGTPDASKTTIDDDLKAYHERNQEFLRQAEKDRAQLQSQGKGSDTFPLPSTIQQRHPSRAQHHLPPRPGAFGMPMGRRQLKSIGNDDSWSEEGDAHFGHRNYEVEQLVRQKRKHRHVQYNKGPCSKMTESRDKTTSKANEGMSQPNRADPSRLQIVSSDEDSSSSSPSRVGADVLIGIPQGFHNESILEKELFQTLVNKATHNARQPPPSTTKRHRYQHRRSPRRFYVSSDSDDDLLADIDADVVPGGSHTYERDASINGEDYPSVISTLSNPSYLDGERSEYAMGERAAGRIEAGRRSPSSIHQDSGETSPPPPPPPPRSRRSHNKKTRRERRHERFIKRYFHGLLNERQTLIAHWRREFELEEAERRHQYEQSWRADWARLQHKFKSSCSEAMFQFLSYVEVFIANMPLTIGALGLGWVTQGVIWFKFMEENVASCTTVYFNSPQCTYPEFPGCFECDTINPIYRVVVTFHYLCHFVAATCCILFLLKCCLAWRSVADELSNPTTSTPCGVVCIAMICVAAGRGIVGEVIVLITSTFHFALSIWFLYIAIGKYRLLPDPGWFPNTVGIAYAAIKTWLYFPTTGLILMSICMLYLFSTFFIAIYRAYYNPKIAAPVCFISLSAPSITMYAMTIMAQPTKVDEELIEESSTFTSYWDDIHRQLYLPIMNGMLVFCLIGYASALSCLWMRWDKFKLKPFSPAHVAFIFPILSHTNAVQAYRSGVDSYSPLPDGHPLKLLLFNYWLVNLVLGTVLNFIFTYKYIAKLPRWTQLDTTLLLGEDEVEEPPPSPSHTVVSEMLEDRQDGSGGARECIQQTYTSPAVLQANEAGMLVRVRRGTEEYMIHGPYVRTRNVTSYGFDLTLTKEEFRTERAELLDWVARNAPRTRNRTVSIPTMMKLKGRDGADIYGTFHQPSEEHGKDQVQDQPGEGTGSQKHRRSKTWGWV